MTNSQGNANRHQLQGQVALITGGAQGIGLAIAKRFQAEGAQVFILDCDERAAQKAITELNSDGAAQPSGFLKADLSHPASIQDAIEALRRQVPKLNILINNAGIELEKGIEALSVTDWDNVLQVNLRGAFLMTQAALALFPAEGGSIVNVASIHATHAFPGSIPYACSKAGLLALTRNLALELAPRCIRVNSISPGYVDTRLWEEYVRNAANPEELADQTTKLHPVGRRGLPNDVAEAALFLCSSNSSFMTGSDLLVDGGLTIRAHA